jgi:kumamolisin
MHQQGAPAQVAGQVSDPSSSRYRQFLTLAEFRAEFAPPARVRNRVRDYLRGQDGVKKVELSADGSVVLAVVTPAAGRRLFCTKGSGPPSGGLCKPRPLRGKIGPISAGEIYELGSISSRAPSGTPQGCSDATSGGAFAPNQLSTAYGVDALHARGLDGAGVRVATLSSQEVDASGFRVWAQCFGLPAPRVDQIAMPGGVQTTGSAPEETVLDVEALASLAPGLDRITPIFVPLDQGFSNSFVLFMLGALDPSRQGGELPQVLSISDGVCEARFSHAELRLGRRLLAQAAALGISTLAASGDLGFQGCFTGAAGTLFPASSQFATGVGGTDLTLAADNAIADQVVWSTFGTDPSQGVGTGGGPSKVWVRPGYQRAAGIGAQLQPGPDPARLVPDVAAMGSFTPGLAVYDAGGGGWGIGGGTSAATPLTAAMVALVLQQEQRAGRPPLGSLPPLLYELARGPGYGTVFYDVTSGTSSRKPGSAPGQSPAGGAAQPGYDLATGLGSLKATAFADAVAALP